MSRSQAWFDALATRTLPSWYRSVALADCDLGGGQPARLLAVVPDPDNAFPRARRGEVGLLEGIGLARAVREVIELDSGLADDQRRPIVAVVDVPSQAYGRLEEQFGEYLYIAAAVDAYATARVAGHPVVALVVGSAISGGFLAHGLQASQILALNERRSRDPGHPQARGGADHAADHRRARRAGQDRHPAQLRRTDLGHPRLLRRLAQGQPRRPAHRRRCRPGARRAAGCGHPGPPRPARPDQPAPVSRSPGLGPGRAAAGRAMAHDPAMTR